MPRSGLRQRCPQHLGLRSTEASLDPGQTATDPCDACGDCGPPDHGGTGQHNLGSCTKAATSRKVNAAQLIQYSLEVQEAASELLTKNFVVCAFIAWSFAARLP